MLAEPGCSPGGSHAGSVDHEEARGHRSSLAGQDLEIYEGAPFPHVIGGEDLGGTEHRYGRNPPRLRLPRCLLFLVAF